ncbi:MAG: methyltransferase [Paracoccaceae bacterium]|nr:methyltransferase [Paracoccaceae bacterium]
MTSDRIRHAIDSGGLVLPTDGVVAVVGAPGDMALDWIDPARVEIVQGFRPDHDAWLGRGFRVVTGLVGPYAAVVLTLPRARDLAEALLAEACAACPGGLIVLNGAKTDGIEALAKALKARVALAGTVSKAHGKVLWFTASDALQDWARPAQAANAHGDVVAPGVFSADAPDPASVALAAALPAKLKGAVADLGAGWGWLSREVLRHDGVRALHLVEADLRALDCARANVSDERAVFHWADARDWKAPSPLDVVVMNPPFHTGRKADPTLGQAFITAAARMLSPSGQLWMVANRHLPYEVTLAAQFREHREVAGDARFKILNASRPTRQRR